METVALERRIPITGDADVLVAGGGLGGVAAALAAARAGARVILTEANGFLGGVATAGMCCSVFNCLFTRQRELKVAGIPLEIVDALAVEAGGPGMSWREHKGHVIYDVERAKLLLDTLLRQAGVEVRLNSPVIDALGEDGRVTALVVGGKNGQEAITCRVLVDATGDCDAAALAGAPCVQKPTLKATYVFRLGNVDVDRFVEHLRTHPEEYPNGVDIEWTLEEALTQYAANGTFLFPHHGGMQLSGLSRAIENGDYAKTYGKYTILDATQMHLIRDTGVCHVITGYVPNDDLGAVSLSDSIYEGKQIAFYFADCMNKYMPGFERAFVSATADDLGIRGSRSIVGESTFTREMKASAHRCADAVGIGVIETHQKLHNGKETGTAQVFGNDVYEIPLSCLIPRGTDNILIGAGRGADTEPALQLRVMVTTMAVGQGAGVAAAVAAKAGVAVRDADYAAIRRELVRQGVAFPEA